MRRLIWLIYLGPVVQSVVSLTSSLVVKMLTVVVSTISNSDVFCWKNVSSFCKSSYMPYLMIKVLTIRKLTTPLVLNNWAQNISYHFLIYILKLIITALLKRPGGRVVSAPNFKSSGPGLISRWNRIQFLHCTELFKINLPSSRRSRTRVNTIIPFVKTWIKDRRASRKKNKIQDRASLLLPSPTPSTPTPTSPNRKKKTNEQLVVGSLCESAYLAHARRHFFHLMRHIYWWFGVLRPF